MIAPTQTITPFLWFNDNAQHAAEFYVSIFKNSRIGGIVRYGDAGPGPKDTVMTVTFSLAGQEFVALNGGPHFSFNEAISFVVNCDSQEELDEYWEQLSRGGEELECGWLKDRFGVSWQVVPKDLGEMMQSRDPERSARVMKSVLKMKKLDVAMLRRAYDGVEDGAGS